MLKIGQRIEVLYCEKEGLNLKCVGCSKKGIVYGYLKWIGIPNCLIRTDTSSFCATKERDLKEI